MEGAAVSEFCSFTHTHIEELSVIIESKLDPIHVSAGTGDYFVFETSIEVSGGILTDLHPGQVFSPELNGDLSPGFGYFMFGKFGMGALH